MKGLNLVLALSPKIYGVWPCVYETYFINRK